MPDEPQLLTPAQSSEAAALWAEAHPQGGPCAGGAGFPELRAAEECWGVQSEGRLVGLAVARRWGRVAHVHGVAVAPDARGKGVGGQLLAGVTSSLVRGGAAVIGGEVGSDLRTLAWVARHGYKPAQLTFTMERAVRPTASCALEASARVVMAPAARFADAIRVAHLAAALDADLDPTSWMERLLADGAGDVLLLEREESAAGDSPLAGVAVVRSIAAPEGTLVASMALLDEGPPFLGLVRLAAALDALALGRGLGRVAVVTPSRYWEPFRALLALGFRPTDPALRVTLHGHPERADVLRPCLASWR